VYQPNGPTLRYYQAEAIDAFYRHLREKDTNPCIVLPTGAGKSAVQATIARDVSQVWGGRILLLSHVKELVEQVSTTITGWYPGLDVGVYSAGLGKRQKRSKVTVAGIQSVYKRAFELTGDDPFNVVLVDEAHTMPPDGEGMYQTLIGDLRTSNPNIRIGGLTATPYRTRGGYICGPERILNEICYEASVRELMAKGFLTKLISKDSDLSVDASQFKVRGGEFDEAEMEAAFDGDETVTAAVEEIIDLAKDRKSILIFCCSIAHANHVADKVRELTGQHCDTVSSLTQSDDRDEIIKRFKSGQVRWLTNVNVLTTGFDSPTIDCVVMLRSTLSPGLYYQALGRGLRIAPLKRDCLVLDYGGNIMRHGCIDDIKIKDNTRPNGDGEPLAKKCPNCHSVVAMAYGRCPDCGHEFPPRERKEANHSHVADSVAVTTDQVKPTRFDCSNVTYRVHVKRDAPEGHPRTLRVTYWDGLQPYCDEWICVEHPRGFARSKAEKWWQERSNSPFPDDADHALELAEAGHLARPKVVITIEPPGERFPKIIGFELGEKPDPAAVEFDEWGDPIAVQYEDTGVVTFGYTDEDLPF